MIKMRRSIQMRCISLVHFVLNTGITMMAWLLWCAPLIDTPDAQTMSLAICACYMVFSIFLFRTYNAYKIGMYRAGEVFYAQTLANLFSSAITYLFACLIRLRLLAGACRLLRTDDRQRRLVSLGQQAVFPAASADENAGTLRNGR